MAPEPIPEPPSFPSLISQNLYLASPAALAAYLTTGNEDPWVRAPHHDLINSRLLKTALGQIRYLMVKAPPRHGKSELCSHWFPTWYLSLFPQREIIFVTYAFEFAREWGIKIRSSLKEFYPELGVKLHEDSRKAHRFITRYGGGLKCVGVGGDITGRGAALLIADDLVKNPEEALSEAIQKRNWDWLRAAFRTRLTATSSVVLIGTCWSTGDVMGKLTTAHDQGSKTEGYIPWTFVTLRAISEGPDDDPLGRPVGEPLWPRDPPPSLRRRFDLDELREIETTLGTFWFSALYMQRPVPIGGDLIKEHWHNYWVPSGSLQQYPPVVVLGRECRVVELPKRFDAVFQSWDMNHRDSIREIERGKEPDAVSGLVMGGDDANLFVLDRFCKRVGLNATIDAVRMISSANPEARTKIVEYTANGPAVIAKLTRELGGFIPATPRGSKTSRVLGNPEAGANAPDRGARAVGLASFIEAGNFFLPHPDLPRHPWVTEYRANLGLFPKAGKDDADATSQGWAWWQQKAWRLIDRQQREASKMGEPEHTTWDIFRNRMKRAYQRERDAAMGKDRGIPGSNVYARMRRMQRG